MMSFHKVESAWLLLNTKLNVIVIFGQFDFQVITLVRVPPGLNHVSAAHSSYFDVLMQRPLPILVSQSFLFQ